MSLLMESSRTHWIVDHQHLGIEIVEQAIRIMDQVIGQVLYHSLSCWLHTKCLGSSVPMIQPKLLFHPWNHWHLTILNVYLDWLEHFELWQLGQWINHATTCLLWCNWFIGEPGIHGEDQGGWAFHGGLGSSRLGLKSIFTKNFESGWRVLGLVAIRNFQITSDWAWCFEGICLHLSRMETEVRCVNTLKWGY